MIAVSLIVGVMYLLLGFVFWAVCIDSNYTPPLRLAFLWLPGLFSERIRWWIS